MWGGASPSEWLEQGQSMENWGNPSRSQLRMGLFSHGQDAGDALGQHWAAKGVRDFTWWPEPERSLWVSITEPFNTCNESSGYSWHWEGAFPSTTQRKRTQNTSWGRESWPGDITNQTPARPIVDYYRVFWMLNYSISNHVSVFLIVNDVFKVYFITVVFKKFKSMIFLKEANIAPHLFPFGWAFRDLISIFMPLKIIWPAYSQVSIKTEIGCLGL